MQRVPGTYIRKIEEFWTIEQQPVPNKICFEPGKERPKDEGTEQMALE